MRNMKATPRTGTVGELHVIDFAHDGMPQILCTPWMISFQLEAHDEHEKIAIGTHKLRVIETARLAKRVQKKTPVGEN